MIAADLLDATRDTLTVQRAEGFEQISGNQLALNAGTLYPALVKLKEMDGISSAWGELESGRRVKVYSLPRARQ